MSLMDRLSLPPDTSPRRSSAMLEGIEHSARYLASDAAYASLELDPYWPKWDSPWWHALALFEVREAARIPARMAQAMAARIDRLEHTFPIKPEDFDPALDPSRAYLCLCAAGCMTQVLSACGVAPLPWLTPWIERHQMLDGGHNCDNEAYLAKDECPSSMVGTVPLLEAALVTKNGDRAAVDRAAKFMLVRELRLGSNTVHNAEERTAAEAWMLPTFPRFYFYDVLRGLAVITDWARATNARIPLSKVQTVLDGLLTAYPSGLVTVGRNASTKHGSLMPGATPDAKWIRAAASRFPLMEATSVIGEVSPALTDQWTRVRRDIVEVLSPSAD